MPQSIHDDPDKVTDPGREPFRPLDFPAGYANDVMRHVIDNNCVTCARPDPSEVAEFGPGGSCAILSAIFVDDSIPEMSYDGNRVTCHERVPDILCTGMDT